MRVISGRLKGRTFESPHTRKTHPMSDRVRGALFNALGELDGMAVLDPYAGTGALSFEAISRGASSVVAVEIHRPAQKVIAANIMSLDLEEKVQLIRGNANAWLRRNKDAQFDVVLCDPPYDNIDPQLLRNLADAVKPGGVYVLSWPGREEVISFDNLVEIQHKTYGDAELIFYRRQS